MTSTVETEGSSTAPLIVAGFVLFASLINTTTLPKRMRGPSSPHPAKHHIMAVGPSSVAAIPIMLVTFVIGAFYSIEMLPATWRTQVGM